jgi:hypothetical protein
VALRRDVGQAREGRLPDATLGRADRAQERGVVVVVRDEAEVRDDVLDLGALEHRLPARDVVGDVLRAKRRLEHLRLVVAAIQDREVRIPGALLEAHALDARDDHFGFRLVVGRGRGPDGVAVPEVAPQLLVEELLVVGDQRVGRAQDAHGRAIVLLELHDLEVGKVARKRCEVVERRPAPSVDRLVVVAHGSERRAVSSQRPA